MTEEKKEMDASMWFSSYGLITAKRILDRFDIHIDDEELTLAINNSQSIYYQLLRVPLKNIFNGIILQQAHDYQVYAQKLFIDYLLSAESVQNEEGPGANTREDLETERVKLISVGEGFSQQESEHLNLIAESQATLIGLSKNLQTSLQTATKKIQRILKESDIQKDDVSILKALHVAMVPLMSPLEKSDVETFFMKSLAEALDVRLTNELKQKLSIVLNDFGDPRVDLENTLASYLERAATIGTELRSYRRQFYDIILQTTELINYLPDHLKDEEREEENRSSLYFDSNLGGE